MTIIYTIAVISGIILLLGEKIVNPLGFAIGFIFTALPMILLGIPFIVVLSPLALLFWAIDKNPKLF